MMANLVVLVAIALAACVKAAPAAPVETTGVADAPAASQSVSPQPAGDTGIIEGVVRYQADANRPWKFSRYYMQDPKSGPLAETVVALEGAGLASLVRADAPKTRTMDQVNYQFVPETVALRAGDSVRISNSDDALHNVMTADGDEPFNVNVVKNGEFTHAFKKAGGIKAPIHLGCVFHGGMRAWIYVFAHPWFKVTEREGRFRFEHVPVGEYSLGVVHPAGKLTWSRRIEVKANVLTPVEITLSPDDLRGAKSNGS